MTLRKTLVLFGVVLNAGSAQEMIQVTTDDQVTPVQSIVYADGMRLDVTDERGLLAVTNEQCGRGAAVTAEPIESHPDYITPSSTGYCIGDADPVHVILTRRIILERAEQWARQASDDQN